MSKNGILCKFFAHGACLKGEHCEYLHDWNAPPNNICTFYQKGACAYGSRCRYEHVKISRPQPSASSSSKTNPSHYTLLDSVPAAIPSGAALGGLDNIAGVKPAWVEDSGHDGVSEFSGIGGSRSLNPADHPICSFAAAGNCPRGETCPHIHGDLCSICGKHCLHPFRPQEREDHMKTCIQREKHLEALKHSQEIECSVCLDRVLSKPTAAERKFGILSECDHPFCISCIRSWRGSSPSHGIDVNSASRTCPICRKLSYFVIPSVIWYFNKEEKDEIVDGYKAKLRSIACKYFDFGNGSCPFGTSCFYKHTVKPGSRLWNSTLMPDLYSSRFFDVDEEKYSSDEENKHVSVDLFNHFYRPRQPIEVEVDNSTSEDLDDDDDALALLFMLGALDMSDLSDEDFDIY